MQSLMPNQTEQIMCSFHDCTSDRRHDEPAEDFGSLVSLIPHTARVVAIAEKGTYLRSLKKKCLSDDRRKPYLDHQFYP